MDSSFLLQTGFCLYIVPVFGMVVRAVRMLPGPKAGVERQHRRHWTDAFGLVEYNLSLARDLFCSLLALFLLAQQMSSGAGLLGPLLLLMMPSVAIWHRRLGNRYLIKHLLKTRTPHPDDLYRIAWQVRSLWPPTEPVQTRTITTNHVDFTNKPAPLSKQFAFGMAVLDTVLLAHLVLQASKELSEDEFRNLFDACATLWSTRTASHLRLELRVTGQENLRDVSSQAIILFNHESLMDYCLGFVATGAMQTNHGRQLSPRFIAAKDHFQDNPIIHTILGVGRAMTAAGMVFVDRKTPGAARTAIVEAAKTLIHRDVDVAVFPQGTRARAHTALDGSTGNAGYYTTTKHTPAGRAHFRRGFARIASVLAEHKSVNIVCIAVQGTAAVVAAKSFRADTYKTVRYHILPPIQLEQGQVIDEKAFTSEIERLMRKQLKVNARLLAAWATELNRTESQQRAVAEALTEWDTAPEPIPYAVLDMILSFAPAERRGWLERFGTLALDGASGDTWDEFRSEVTAAL